MSSTAAARSSPLRDASRRLVLEQLSGGVPVSQQDLIETTGLSRSTVASVLAELQAEHRVVTVPGAAPGGRGRPPKLLTLAAGTGVVAALDLGHAHLALALADLAGTVLLERRIPMDVDSSAEAAVAAATALLDQLLGELAVDHPDAGRPKAIVIGVPGPVQEVTGKLLSGTILPGWVGSHPAEDFTAALGRPVLLENDANLGAVGEHVYGRGRGVRNLLYVKVSTGIGAGMILHGTLYRGSRGTAGEIGHVQVREDGLLCRCGSRGCLETISSTEAALALLRQAHGRHLTLEDVLRIVDDGDPGAVRLITDMGTAIGRVIGAVSANLDPELVVIGGPLARAGGPLLDGITAAVRRYTQPYVAVHLTVAAGELGSRAALLGAVATAVQIAGAEREIAVGA